MSFLKIIILKKFGIKYTFLSNFMSFAPQIQEKLMSS